ncbi:NAD-dependent succinate-semialdehyde dehydrogenase [Chloroflexota bacterium]
MKIRNINPTTGEALKEYDEMPVNDICSTIRKTHQAFLNWREVSFAERADFMRKAAGILRSRSEEYARLMAREIGKPVQDGRAEVEKCAWACDYFADQGALFLQPEIVSTYPEKSYVAFIPLGVILAVMPWNYPFWQIFRCAVPSLMAGNVVLLKHASNVPGCALSIEDIFNEAGFPSYTFTTLLAGSSKVDAIIENPLVKGVSFTGSVAAGRAVAKKAGEMLKKTVLELGGSDPYLVLGDAGLKTAVTVCAAARLVNCGQSCIAAKRFIVVESQKENFEKMLVQQMGTARMGDPMQKDTAIGPLARHDLRDYLHRQVVRSIEMGARCILGGRVPEGKGAFYPPTVLTDVRKGMPVFDEESFGPVAAIVPVKDDEEAIMTANHSDFGLGAAVFTSDLDRGEQIAAQQLEAGLCFVNSQVKSDPRLPFGGVKDSGYGRELSHFGIREFVNTKTVVVAHD